MAEGEDLTSVKDGSDVDFEYTCSLCGDGHIRVEAVKYCPVCQEYLCMTCIRHHGKLKVTRSHQLLNCDASMKVPKVTMVTKCRYHPGRDIEMYCGEHDMVYCAMCFATEHSLEDVNVALNFDTEIERLKTELEDMKKRLKVREKKTKTNIDSVEAQRCEVVSKIEKLERDLVEHIQTLKHEALETLDTKYNLVKEKLEVNISQTKKINVEIEQECNKLQTFNDKLDMRQQFVQTKLIQHTLNDAMKVIEQSESIGCQGLHFTENKELKSSILTSKSFGCIQNVNECNSPLSSSIYKVISKKEKEMKFSNENKLCDGSAICQLLDGTIVLADWNNKRIKRLDLNDNIKDYFDVGDYPTGICCTGKNEIAVKLYNNKVQFILVGTSLSKLRDISVTGGKQWGIAYCAGELLVSTGSGLDVYSMSGSLLKTIIKDVNDQNIFKISPEQMAVCRDTVIVTDNGAGAVCLRRDGSVIRELRDCRLTTSKTVCVSNDGTVFIAGYDSQNIVMFDKEGKCLGELIDRNGDLKNPTCMCFDKKRKCIVVFSGYSNMLVVLNISY